MSGNTIAGTDRSRQHTDSTAALINCAPVLLELVLAFNDHVIGHCQIKMSDNICLQ
jgi:hypothetical protein